MCVDVNAANRYILVILYFPVKSNLIIVMGVKELSTLKRADDFESIEVKKGSRST